MFKDPKLELEYFACKQLPNIATFGKIIMGQIVLVNVIDLAIEIYQNVEGEDGAILSLGFKILAALIVLGIIIVHYFLSLKYRFFAYSFGWFQTLFNTVILVERAVENNEDGDDFDSLVVMLMVIHSLAMVSYCQRNLLIVHICVLIYFVGRIHNHY